MRTSPILVIALAGMAIWGSCSSAPVSEQRWRVSVSGTDGVFIGGLVLDLTSETTKQSCLGGVELTLAQVVEKHGFENERVGETVGVSIHDGQFYADLSLGICDNTLTVSGPLRGRRVTGEARRSTVAGSLLVGRFIAESSR